jgi:hypothetical protein
MFGIVEQPLLVSRRAQICSNDERRQSEPESGLEGRLGALERAGSCTQPKVYKGWSRVLREGLRIRVRKLTAMTITKMMDSESKSDKLRTVKWRSRLDRKLLWTQGDKFIELNAQRSGHVARISRLGWMWRPYSIGLTRSQSEEADLMKKR